MEKGMGGFPVFDRWGKVEKAGGLPVNLEMSGLQK